MTIKGCFSEQLYEHKYLYFKKYKKFYKKFDNFEN